MPYPARYKLVNCTFVRRHSSHDIKIVTKFVYEIFNNNYHFVFRRSRQHTVINGHWSEIDDAMQ